MKRRHREIRILKAFAPLYAAIIAAIAITGCTRDDVFLGKVAENQVPNIELTNGPIEGDSIEYHVHFFWYGDDPDGEIDHYEIILVEGDPIGFNPADTAGIDKWTFTTATDSVFKTTADVFNTTVTINEATYAVFSKYHTLFIRAVDNRGAASPTLFRSFNAWTLAPHINIESPSNPRPGSLQYLTPLTTFKWTGKDPIDSPWNYRNVDSTRYMLSSYYPEAIDQLNESPEMFESRWSKWYPLDAEGDSAISTIIGDDEILTPGRAYMLAVQAKDDAGALSAVFNLNTNVRAFSVRTPTGPMLNVTESFLGRFNFVGVDLVPKTGKVPPGFQMKFSWNGDASQYGGVISSYRYGWDIENFDDPTEWEEFPSPYVKNSQPKTFFSGIHTFYIEAYDNLGIRTLAIIEITVIPSVFENDLLWVDDFPSNDFQQLIYAFPTESAHDEFWINICLRAAEFNPARDIFDVSEHDFRAPPMETIFKYRNIIWSFSGAVDPIAGSSWTRLILFTPEELVPLDARVLNYIPFYMAAGGHIWSVGMCQRTGGLGAALRLFQQIFPNYLKCNAGSSAYGCADTLGVECMPYRDFCVSTLDKIEAIFKTDIPFNRDISLDAARYMLLDEQDNYTLDIPGFPRRLDLWDKVTQPGMFFYPQTRGFHYIEIYDADYWMRYVGATSQSCFHPLYRMQAIVSRSVLHNQPVAFWTTKYADRLAPNEEAIRAPSVHFGLPLWFFNRAQVDSVADAIFTLWEIK
ncbi:MAG: hypothetical protein JW814_06785 [Candidatus Krumholzibacteriota bacterium]|nr:hypothetical protein [Candidatus Krumholzibacteriota bacterium]